MANEFKFTKMQGVGNDFVLIDGRLESGYNWSTLAMEACDRRFGIGADGLLVLDNTHQADVMMRMYNPDGTPDVCGNGLRCVARYAMERGGVNSSRVRVQTLAGVRDASLVALPGASSSLVQVSMGQPRFTPSEIPMSVCLEEVKDFQLQLKNGVSLQITSLSTGSTHSITFVKALPEDEIFFDLSPEVEAHPLFPDRTSLMWCRVIEEGLLELRIWERGAGETWGCGTGACAAAVAAIRLGFAKQGEPISVISKGGKLTVEWREGEAIRMTGPAEFVYEGVYPK